MTCITHFLRPYVTRIRDSNPEADLRAAQAIHIAEVGYAETLDHIVESAEVQQTHRFIRERNHLGPALLDPVLRRGKTP